MIIKKYQTTIKIVDEKCYIDKINSKIPPIKKRLLRKKEQNKEDKIRENLLKSNYHWNYWRFQLHWVELEL